MLYSAHALDREYDVPRGWFSSRYLSPSDYRGHLTPDQEDTHADISRRSSARTLILDKKNKPKAMDPFGTHDEFGLATSLAA